MLLQIVGLGPGGSAGLSVAALDALRAARHVLLRTSRHPTVALLDREGIRYTSFDNVYEAASTLEDVYQTIAAQVLMQAQQADGVVYAVPGHPLVAERSVALLLEAAPAAGVQAHLVPSPSFIDACLEALSLPVAAGVQAIDAQAMPAQMPSPALPALIYQVDDVMVASQAKLALLEVYPEDAEVTVVRAAGVEGLQSIERVPLYKLDRVHVDHLTTVYVPAAPLEKRRPTWDDLVEVTRRLRAPDGCPWDREQTHQSLRRYLLEETYEALEALDANDMERLCDELGDILLQVTLHSQLAAEDGDFDIRDVVSNITRKLIRRHPHVFGDVQVSGSDEVLRNWERIKADEKVGRQRQSVMDGVPKELPALMKALEVSQRAVKVGFEWERMEDLWAKLHEEIQELRQAVDADEPEAVLSEVGDLLFTVVNVARWLKVDPEEALRLMVARFAARFRYMEGKLAEQGRAMADASLSELDALWNEAKLSLP